MNTPTTLSVENPGVKSRSVVKKRRKLILVGVLTVGLFSCVCLCLAASIFVFSKVNLKTLPSPITIGEVFMTTGLDEQGQPFPATKQFSSGQAKVYCFVRVTAPQPIPVGIRWFYQDELILDQQETVNRAGAFVITPPPGKGFRVGEYRVEVYLVKEAIGTVYFSVAP